MGHTNIALIVAGIPSSVFLALRAHVPMAGLGLGVAPAWRTITRLIMENVICARVLML